MNNLTALKSYLVQLGFEVNQPQLNQFNQTLRAVSQSVERHASGIVANFAKVGGAIIGTYAAIGTATVGLMHHVADADMGYQLFAQKMFMSADAAKRMKIATDALGYSLEEVAWNPELRGRYEQLIALQTRLQHGLGPDYAQQMRQLRDIGFEFTKTRVEMQYLGMQIVQSLFKSLGLGGGDVLTKLRQFNDWIVRNIPRWSETFARYLTPVLKDIVGLGGQFGRLLRNLTSLFIEFTGLVSGDEGLKKGEVTFENIAKASEKWLKALTNIVNDLNIILEWVGAHPELAKILLGAAVGGAVGGPVGAVLGGGVGAAWSLVSEDQKSQRASSAYAGAVNESRARELVARYATKYGVNQALARELVWQESRFNPNALSSKGAIGLMQLMPATAKSLGVDPNNPEQNVDGGMRLLSQLLRKYHGDTRLALAAYNAGEKAVDKYHGVPPYAETQAYVRDIMGRAGQGGTQITVSRLEVNVQQPNATPDQVQHSVREGVREAFAKRAQLNTMQLAAGYQ